MTLASVGVLPVRKSPHRATSRSAYALFALLGLFLTACSGPPPSLTGLEPASGHPHDVVVVQGEDLELAEIVWDVGQPGERVIPGGYQGAYMFSVPDGAEARDYTVVLRNGDGDSAPMTFKVSSAPGPFDEARPPGPDREYPPPRIDAVTLVGATFEPSGVRTTLYVQGANIDVGAVVSVTENIATTPTAVASTSHRVLLNDWFKVPDENFGYPIYHYSSIIAVPGLRPAGASIWVVVTNLGGLKSKPFEYKLPASADEMDSDGDGLTDIAETGGYHADGDGVVDVDLPAMGADPYRRDIFLELDVMSGVLNPPDATVFDGVRRMFEAAPIINYGDARGINLVIDVSTPIPCLPKPGGGEKCSFTTTIFDIGDETGTTSEPDPFVTNIVLFSKLKARGFDNAKRGNVFHYGIWAIQQINRRKGFSDDGDDLVITSDGAGPTYQTTRSQIEILAHELGHNLGQKHGGATDDPERKPNYLSVMSYTWSHRTAWADSVRLERATCLPSYYATPGAAESSSGSIPADVNTVVDYSEGMGIALTRPMPSAAGATYMCGSTINWAKVEPHSVYTVEDFANWPNLVFTGPVTGGTLTP